MSRDVFPLLHEYQRLALRGLRFPKRKHESLNSMLAQQGGHVYLSRIPMSDREHRSVDKLAESAEITGITRRDPGETGPLLVTINGETTEVDVG